MLEGTDAPTFIPRRAHDQSPSNQGNINQNRNGNARALDWDFAKVGRHAGNVVVQNGIVDGSPNAGMDLGV